MQLSYRGVKYEYNPAQSVKAEYPQPVVNLKYRGASYRHQEVAKVERLNAIFKYRGVQYTQPAIAPVAQPVAQPVAVAAVQSGETNVETKARLLNRGHNQSVRNRHQVMLARFASNEGFVGNLSQYWNQVQGEVDTALWANYDRSHAGLS